MDPRLFDTVWEVYREVGSEAPVRVNSAYRSPNTNAMLRRRSSAVAKNSQHMLGKALDFYLPDVPTERLRAIGMRLQNGGVGYYPNAYTPFVHLDVGSVRAWPRMTRDQLARIFPDGKTVHVPSDGTPFSRYEEARAEVLAKGGTVGGYSAVADADEVVPTRRKSFWATLFGGADEDEDAEEIRATFAARPQSPGGRRPQCVAAGILRQRFQFERLCGLAAEPVAAAFAPAHPRRRHSAAARRGTAGSGRRRRRRARPAGGDRVAAAAAADPDRRPAADGRDLDRSVPVLAAGSRRAGDERIGARRGVRAHAAPATGRCFDHVGSCDRLCADPTGPAERACTEQPHPRSRACLNCAV